MAIAMLTAFSIIAVPTRPRPRNQIVPSRARHAAVHTPVQGLQTVPQTLTNPRQSVAKAPLRPAAAVDKSLDLRGCVLASANFMSFVPGLYNVPLDAEGQFELVTSAFAAEYGSYNDGNGKYYVPSVLDYGMGFVIPELYVYDTGNWDAEPEYIECGYSILGTDNATDPTTGMVYGCFYDEDYENLTWGRADFPSGMSTTIKTLTAEERMFGVACDAAGQYYAVLGNGDFVKVEKTTGEMTVVGNTGLAPYYASGAVFDNKSGNVIFSYSAVTGAGSLWAIDPATGTASLIVDFTDDEEITSLEIIVPADPASPAAPELTASVDGGSETVNLTLVLPANNAGGEPGTGRLRWNISVNGNETVGSGEGEFGETVNCQYVAPAKGAYSFSAYAENDYGRSPLAKADIIVGAGVPETPSGLTCTVSGTMISLSWQAVTTSANGGYIDPAEVTYTVWRNGEVLEENIADTWYYDFVSAPETFVKYNYEVTANYGGEASAPAKVTATLGAFQPPYADHFYAEPYGDDLFTVVNANGDNVEWYFSAYYNCFKYDYGDNAADDWLFSPALALSKDCIYEVSYSVAAGHTMYTERYAFAMGNAPTPEAMTKTLVDATVIEGDLGTPNIVTLSIAPEEDGNYYFGWHALSDPQMFMIQVKNFKVSAPMQSTSPAGVSDITLTSDADGALLVNGTFKAPEKDITGNALTGISSIVVRRSDKEAPVEEIVSPAPGSVCEFSDSDIPAMGTYTYIITAYDAAGNIGREVSSSLYVGPLAPEDVPSVSIAETSVGVVTLTWTAPEKDVNGRPLNPENLSYMVYRVYTAGSGGEAVEVFDAPITALTAEIKACEPDESAFAVFCVKAFNRGLESVNFTRSDMLAVGFPEQTPYRHSFNEEDRMKYLLGYVLPSEGYSTVSIASDEDAGVAAQDADNAMLSVYSTTQYAAPEFFTSKIHIPAGTETFVSFYEYVWSEADINEFTPFVRTTDDVNHELATVANTGAAHTGWNLHRFSLLEYAGKDVMLGVRATIISHETMLFDNFVVSGAPETDMSATALNVPARANMNEDFEVSVTVANMGTSANSDYTVSLEADGKSVASAVGPALEPGKEAIVRFTQKLSSLAPENVTYVAKTVCSADAMGDNDATTAVTVTVVRPNLPVVGDLAGTFADNGVLLTWSAPDCSGYDIKTPEDFENARAWTEEVEGWTMVDRDGLQIGTLDGVYLPENVATRTQHSFFVFDNESDEAYFYNPDLVNLVKAYSGTKTLVAMYTLPMDKNQDDWAISPELSGEAQTLTFQARSYHPDYLDHMEVLYSTANSVNPDDFVTLCPGGAFEVPQLTDVIGHASYKLYEFELPAGARRLALRATNDAGTGFMLMIDDVSFKVANAVLAVDSYDVYRDGVKVNAAPVTGCSYVDIPDSDGRHAYNVVPNFNRGTGAASNTVYVETSSVEGLCAGVRITVADRIITVSGAGDDEPVNVYSVDGMTIYSGYGDTTVEVEPGIYFIKVGNTIVKTIVK